MLFTAKCYLTWKLYHIIRPRRNVILQRAIIKFLPFRPACASPPERGNQPSAISFTLITFYYYEPRREGVWTVFRTFISRKRKSTPGAAPRVCESSSRHRAREGSRCRARLAIHSRAWLLLSRWRGLRAHLTQAAARRQ